MGRAPALIAVPLVIACSSTVHHATPDVPVAADAASDAASIDADLVDFDLTGSYLDWDSTVTAPCPIIDALWTVTYDNTRTASTDRNGAFTISLTSYYVEMDVMPPTTTVTCATSQSVYQLRGHAIVPPAVYYAGGHFVARAMTMARVGTLYAAIGSPFDASRANLLVHIDGPARMVSIDLPHATEQAFDGSQWAAGAVGGDVYFPNIDVSGGVATTVTVTGGAIGTGSVRLVSGEIFYMTVITN